MNHTLKMLLGCLLPLLLIFVLPSLGVSNGVTLFIFIILMFGCHLLMMGGHHGAHGQNSDNNQDKGGHGGHHH